MSQVWTVKIVGQYYELLDENNNSIHITTDRNLAYLLDDICKRHNATYKSSDDAYDSGFCAGFVEGCKTASNMN